MANILEEVRFCPFHQRKTSDLVQTTSLISHARKIMLKIILKCLQIKIDEEANLAQAGVPNGTGTKDHIFNIRNIIENFDAANLYASFKAYSKALYCVQHEAL